MKKVIKLEPKRVGLGLVDFHKKALLSSCPIQYNTIPYHTSNKIEKTVRSLDAGSGRQADCPDMFWMHCQKLRRHDRLQQPREAARHDDA
eukprot:scaffold1064_cov85-Amphora_coffeaeformis.AAC.14